MRLNGKVNAPVGVVSGVPPGVRLRAVVVYIIHFEALPYYWEPFSEPCG